MIKIESKSASKKKPLRIVLDTGVKITASHVLGEIRKGDDVIGPHGHEGTIVSVSSPRKGRPRIEDRDKTIEARKPWAAAGMSRATWYRRKSS